MNVDKIKTKKDLQNHAHQKIFAKEWEQYFTSVPKNSVYHPVEDVLLDVLPPISYELKRRKLNRK
jgi:uncharacterized membrane protein